jgi:hypothetical protein
MKRENICKPKTLFLQILTYALATFLNGGEPLLDPTKT